MESLTLSVCLFYLRICYDSLIACISQMIVFNKKKWPGWRCDCRFLSGKQQERQGTGNLCILPSWEQLGQARHCAEECYGWNTITCNTVQIQPCHHSPNTTAPETGKCMGTLILINILPLGKKQNNNNNNNKTCLLCFENLSLIEHAQTECFGICQI